MKLEIFDIVIPIAIIFFLLDIVQGEFTNPTLLDFIKLGSFILMLTSYIIYKIKSTNHE